MQLLPKSFRAAAAALTVAVPAIALMPANDARAVLCTDTQLCTLNFTQGNASSGFGTGNFGDLTLEVISAGDIFVAINLNNGWRIPLTGFPGVEGFVDSLGGGLVATNFSSPLYSGNTSDPTNDLHFDGFGYANNAVGTDGPHFAQALPSLSFELIGAGLNDVNQLLNSFNPAGGDGPAVWVTDAANADGSKTGLVSILPEETPPNPVPEPASLAILGAGLIGLGLILSPAIRRPCSRLNSSTSRYPASSTGCYAPGGCARVAILPSVIFVDQNRKIGTRPESGAKPCVWNAEKNRSPKSRLLKRLSDGLYD